MYSFIAGSELGVLYLGYLSPKSFNLVPSGNFPSKYFPLSVPLARGE